jgi:hypothetical protein
VHIDLTFHVADLLVMASMLAALVRNVEMKVVQMKVDIDLLRQRIEWLEKRADHQRAR